jgi:hypothetical protein
VKGSSNAISGKGGGGKVRNKEARESQQQSSSSDDDDLDGPEEIGWLSCKSILKFK